MKQIQTQSLHAGRLHPRAAGAVVTPIYQSSTFEYDGEDYHDVGYLRLSNSPNHRVLNKRLAVLEEAEAALVTGGGMSAISAVLFSLLSQGDHLLVQDCLYGGTSGLIDQDLSRFGITRSVIDVQDPSTWEGALQKGTRAIYVETLTNPLVQMADLEAVVEFARANGIVSIIDNTFASPVLFRPAAAGFDLVVESATKYMGGHNDLIAGVVAGRGDLVRKAKLMLDHLGGSIDALGCFLLERGLKTLELRVRHQCASALTLARALDAHPGVRRVNYPGLPGHAQHERAARLLNGGFGGMMSFEIDGSLEDTEAFLARVTLPAVAASLGGAESLMVRPAAAIHSGLTASERAATGITDTLIRFSVGLEGT
ncbi:MAG: aminotransferase class I/II-fold pyridoxal phosphate-dependent enzyme, partial [Gemmatimonadetes bacterium]|nr:aminotransferase class I/II-fold pyridoxal phosphate-dependent enzyme [Gemmatimonadota bacterium]